jgi:hypothetical protein
MSKRTEELSYMTGVLRGRRRARRAPVKSHENRRAYYPFPRLVQNGSGSLTRPYST